MSERDELREDIERLSKEFRESGPLCMHRKEGGHLCCAKADFETYRCPEHQEFKVGDLVWFDQPYIENFLGGEQKHTKVPASIADKKEIPDGPPIYKVLIKGQTEPSTIYFPQSMFEPRPTGHEK
jgi:hypothetical protein